MTIMSFLWFAGIPLLPAAPQTAISTPQPAVITGLVLRSTTGDPIAGAQVTISRASANAASVTDPAPVQGQSSQVQPAQPTIIPAVTTDERGRFEIKELAPGAYRISVARNGFSKQEYGQRSANRTGRVLNIAAGQRLDDVVFRLTPAGTITGRVLDVKGEPLAGVTIQALRSTYDASGKRALQPAAQGRTNDLGEYRLYWINPGKYYVSANPARSPLDTLTATMSQAPAANPDDAQAMTQMSSIFGAPPNPNEVAASGFALTFFPGTQDVSRAASIDLQPGVESRADFTLARGERFRIRGSVVDPQTNRPPANASVSLSPRNAIGGGGSFWDSLPGLGGLQGNRYNSATGEFEVRDVTPGSYWLQASFGPQGNGLLRTHIPLDVYGSDIENMILTPTAGIAIPGRIRMESNEPLPRVNVSFQLTNRTDFLSQMRGRVQPDAEGTFSILRVTPGEYRLTLTGLPPDAYLRDARLANKDALEGVTISDRVDGVLDVTLSMKSAQIDGAVTSADGKPAGNVQAILVPERLRNRQDLYKTATTNQGGRFNMRGIAPGDYRLFAWEDLEPFAYFDPEVLKQYESQGRLIRVEESSKVTVETKLIPAAK
jgi:5-hydroxyisourate hydrolase-like protein (transthyretin family)